MLVLTLKPGEQIVIDGHTTVRLKEHCRLPVKLVFEAPRDVSIVRSDAKVHLPTHSTAAAAAESLT